MKMTIFLNNGMGEPAYTTSLSAMSWWI